jgi:hypothetical protein
MSAITISYVIKREFNPSVNPDAITKAKGMLFEIEDVIRVEFNATPTEVIVEYRNNGDPLKSIEKEVDETCSRAGL